MTETTGCEDTAGDELTTELQPKGSKPNARLLARYVQKTKTAGILKKKGFLLFDCDGKFCF